MSADNNNTLSVREILYNLDPADRTQFDCYQDETIREQADKIFSSLKHEVSFLKVKQMLWKKIASSALLNEDNLGDQIQSVLIESGCKEIFETMVFKLYQANYQLRLKQSTALPNVPVRAKRGMDERVDHIQQVRQTWDQGLLEELGAIVTEAKRPFLMLRESGNLNPFLSNNSSEANINQNVKFLYDSEDLMETLLSIKNPNLKSDYHDKYIGLVKLTIPGFDYNTILKKFTELTYSYSHLGVDDIHQHPSLLPQPPNGNNNPPAPPAATTAGFKLLQARHEEAEWIIQHGSMLEAQIYLRRGCPPALRNKVWRIACGFAPEKPAIYEDQLYTRLRFDCDRLDLITDELFMYDIQTVIDDPRFFVFEEELKEVIFCFSRDSSVREQILYEIHQPWLKQMGLDFPADSSAPPSGVQPYLGFTTYFAPLCYVFRSKVMLYSMCKYLFCHIWCRLNVFTSDETTIIHLCKTFEGLLWAAQPKLFLHLVSINVQPIKIAFPWIQLGFVGLLEMDQILNLWERVIAYMDPTVFVVAAVAIFVHRSEMLLRCANETDATMILLEGSRLHIISIIQAYLLKDGRNPN